MKQILCFFLFLVSISFYGQTEKKYPIEEYNDKKNAQKNTLLNTEDYYNNAILKNPLNADLYYGRAKCRLQMEQTDLKNFDFAVAGIKVSKTFAEKAMKDLKKAIKLNPAKYSDTAYYYLGIAKLLNYSTSDLRALKDFTIAIKFNPNFVEAYYLKGKINYTLGKYVDGLNDLNKAIGLYNKNHKINLADAYYCRAYCKLFKRNKEDGCPDLAKALELGRLATKLDIDRFCK